MSIEFSNGEHSTKETYKLTMKLVNQKRHYCWASEVLQGKNGLARVCLCDECVLQRICVGLTSLATVDRIFTQESPSPWIKYNRYTLPFESIRRLLVCCKYSKLVFLRDLFLRRSFSRFSRKEYALQNIGSFAQSTFVSPLFTLFFHSRSFVWWVFVCVLASIHWKSALLLLSVASSISYQRICFPFSSQFEFRPFSL